MDRANPKGIRRHLTYANVMVTILAFVVLAGGTAVATIVITSNSQVGRNTISGHKPPNGDRSNIISGSVNSTDLAKTNLHGAGLPLDGSGNCGGASLNEWARLLQAPVGFYRDLEGRVYLQGTAERCGNPPTGDVIFTLPDGFLPSNPPEQFVISEANDNPVTLTVQGNGDVEVFGSVANSSYSLDGVSFRCGAPGNNGCP